MTAYPCLDELKLVPTPSAHIYGQESVRLLTSEIHGFGELFCKVTLDAINRVATSHASALIDCATLYMIIVLVILVVRSIRG